MAVSSATEADCSPLRVMDRTLWRRALSIRDMALMLSLMGTLRRGNRNDKKVRAVSISTSSAGSWHSRKRCSRCLCEPLGDTYKADNGVASNLETGLSCRRMASDSLRVLVAMLSTTYSRTKSSARPM